MFSVRRVAAHWERITRTLKPRQSLIGYQTLVLQIPPHLQEDVLGSIREAVGDLVQSSVVAVEGRGPLDGAVALLRAGLRVGGP